MSATEYDIHDELLKVRLNKNSNSYAVFKDKVQGFGNFFDCHVIDNRFDVEIKQNAGVNPSEWTKS